MTILTRAAGPERLGRVMAILGVPMLLGPIFGPILGGWLIDVASWHWIFLINVPIGIVAVVYAWRVLDRDDVHPSESFDFVGMLLLSPGPRPVPVRRVLDPGREAGARHDVHRARSSIRSAGRPRCWSPRSSPWALRKRNIHPLVQLRLFTNRYMTVAVITMTLFAMAFFGACLLFTLYFQQVRGESPLRSGWLVAPQGFGAMLTMPIAGFLADKIGPGKVVLTGLVLDTVGMGMLIVGRRHDVVRLHHHRVRDHGPRHGLDDDAGLHRRPGQPEGPRHRPRLDADEHHPADRDLDGHGAVLGAAHQRLQRTTPTVVRRRWPSRTARPGVARPAAGPGQGVQVAGLHFMGQSFGEVFLVATVLVGLCLVPAFFLPRKPPQHHTEEATQAAMMG